MVLRCPQPVQGSICVCDAAWLQALRARPPRHTLNRHGTLKVVMHCDLKAPDPVWSGAYIVRNHGYLVYDTLFALDANFQVQPQMAGSPPSRCGPATFRTLKSIQR